MPIEIKDIAQQPVQRQPAKKVRIQEITDAQYVAAEGWNPNVLRINNEDVARVNILGAVVAKATTEIFNYDFFTLDDGTGKITVRSFENKNLSKNFDVGTIAMVIGRPREYGGEVYIAPEIVKKIEDTAWVELRKLELETRPVTVAPAAQKENTSDIVVEKESNPDERVIEYIKQKDSGEGVDVEEIIGRYADAQMVIQRLQLQGDIFEVRPGRVKVL
ncbi:MAG: OB-fold nucleic acid binding domain-containing protein [Candidatus Woesearchaeota archaeon]|nr:OB-fold nucleic acid binding domain-containing protein [Candidatus Woesearchaeota archaeon]